MGIKHKVNFLVTIEARMTSSRLPGKVCLELEKSNTVLGILIDRVRKSNHVNQILVATTKNKIDNKIVEIAKKKGCLVYRGSEKNVLKRYIDAAKKFEINHIIRITADCPFSDPGIIDLLIKKYFKGNYDYVSNVNPPTFPNGFDVEIFKLKIAEKSLFLFKSLKNLEHVTYAIRNKKTKKKLVKKTYNLSNKKNINNLRLTLDNIEDLKKIKKLANYVKINDNWKQIYFKLKKLNNEK